MVQQQTKEESSNVVNEGQIEGEFFEFKKPKDYQFNSNKPELDYIDSLLPKKRGRKRGSAKGG